MTENLASVKRTNPDLAPLLPNWMTELQKRTKTFINEILLTGYCCRYRQARGILLFLKGLRPEQVVPVMVVLLKYFGHIIQERFDFTTPVDENIWVSMVSSMGGYFDQKFPKLRGVFDSPGKDVHERLAMKLWEDICLLDDEWKQVVFLSLFLYSSIFPILNGSLDSPFRVSQEIWDPATGLTPPDSFKS